MARTQSRKPPRSTLECGCAADHREIVLTRVAIHLSSGCWVWLGTLDSSGYGRFAHRQASDGQRVAAFAAHRFSYEAFVGAIPAGRHLDHLCRTRACCNPQHLEPVTPQENQRRMLTSRGFDIHPEIDGKCRHGHSLRRAPTGGWYCPTCRAERYRGGLPAGDARHGTLYAYANFGCRCDHCSEAGRAYRRSRRDASRGSLNASA